MLDFDAQRPPVPPRDAATVLLLREPPAGLEVFLVRRHGKSGFLGGVYVFPGGTVDDDDRDPGWREHVDAIDADEPRRAGGKDDAVAHQIAAVRETFEEAGVWLGDEPELPDWRARTRARLLGGEPLQALVAESRVKLSIDRLVPHARWITPRAEARRYDTLFYAAAVEPEEHAAPDLRETTEGRWLAPDLALDQADDGSIHLAPPTRRTLELLAAAGSARSFLEGCARGPLPVVEPLFKEVDGEGCLLLPGDPEHPVPTRALPGALRLVLRDGHWIAT